MKQFVLDDNEYQQLLDKLADNDPYSFMGSRYQRMIEGSTIEITSRQFDNVVRLIQKTYDVSKLHKDIIKLNATIKEKDQELYKLRFDKTAALKVFIEELRKEPLQVVLMKDDEQ
jgi:hypothetical protein